MEDNSNMDVWRNVNAQCTDECNNTEMWTNNETEWLIYGWNKPEMDLTNWLQFNNGENMNI